MEETICNKVIQMLSLDKDKVGVEHRSNDYTSLVYCNNDFFRVKYTDRSKWISIRLAKEDKNEDDPRFALQKNKGQLHWKAEIDNPNDVEKFKKELINACVSMGADVYQPRTSGSKITLDAKNILERLFK